MKQTVANALTAQLAAIKPIAAPPPEKIFRDAKTMSQFPLRLSPTDNAAVDRIIDAARAHGRKLNSSQAIRVALRTSTVTAGAIDSVLAEDRRRKRT